MRGRNRTGPTGYNGMMASCGAFSEAVDITGGGGGVVGGSIVADIVDEIVIVDASVETVMASIVLGGALSNVVVFVGVAIVFVVVVAIVSNFVFCFCFFSVPVGFLLLSDSLLL